MMTHHGAGITTFTPAAPHPTPGVSPVPFQCFQQASINCQQLSSISQGEAFKLFEIMTALGGISIKEYYCTLIKVPPVYNSQP